MAPVVELVVSASAQASGHVRSLPHSRSAAVRLFAAYQSLNIIPCLLSVQCALCKMYGMARKTSGPVRAVFLVWLENGGAHTLVRTAVYYRGGISPLLCIDRPTDRPTDRPALNSLLPQLPSSWPGLGEWLTDRKLPCVFSLGCRDGQRHCQDTPPSGRRGMHRGQRSVCGHHW